MPWEFDESQLTPELLEKHGRPLLNEKDIESALNDENFLKPGSAKADQTHYQKLGFQCLCNADMHAMNDDFRVNLILSASGEKFLEPEFLNAEAKIGETGVDEIAHANIKFKNGIEAKVSTAIRENMKNNAIIRGVDGSIELPDPWMPGRDGGPYHAKIIISKNNEEEIIDVKGPEHLFFFEAELASQSIAKEKVQAPHPAMSWDDTLGNLKALDQWREKVNYKLPQDE